MAYEQCHLWMGDFCLESAWHTFVLQENNAQTTKPIMNDVITAMTL